ncbi:MAG TPA: ABC transporter permease subunit [Candidatus Nanoarchaeia archaeon]
MWPLFTKTLKTNRAGLLIYNAICIGFVWFYAAFFPSIFKESAKLKEAFQAYPQDLMKAFNINLENFLSSFEGFMSGEYFSLLWPIILIVLIIAYAGSAIAGEIEQGTIELLLAQPISRLRIFFSKYFSGLFIIILFIAISNSSVILFARLYNISFHWQNFVSISILGFLFAFAIFGICFMLSAVSSSKGRPAALTGGLLIIMYALNIFSAFQKSIEDLKYASFFHYFDFDTALLHNHIDLLNISVFLAVGIICTIIGAVAFVKRDIATT